MGVDQPARFFGKQAKKTIQKIARHEADRMIGRIAESKYWDTQSSTSADFSGLIVDLSVVPVGTGDLARIGDKISPTSLEVGFNVIGETFSGIARIVIFRWLDDSTPVPTDIFQALGGGFATVQPFTHDQRSKFNVLSDKRMTVSNNGGSEIVSMRYTLKLAKKNIAYSAGTTTGRSKIYACLVGDRAVVSAPGHFLMTRLNYKDL